MSEPPPRTRVLLADDHAIMLGGLKAILAGELDLEIVGEARNGIEAVAQAKALQPDLLIMDIQMPRLDGLGALVAVREQAPATRVIMLTSVDDQETLFKVIHAGGSGYVLKKSAEDELLVAIREVLAGGAFVRPPIQLMLAADTQARVDAGDSPDGYETLTAREKEVLALLARGFTNQQIADEFVLSVRTVETHRAHIMEKLGLRGRAALVEYAMRKGYLA
ncbi:MAG: response regulator transcription factor [Cyanobacteria bacterium RYN_339]|nr:response regulator transcription factor [Cyanobacteria bacterium RYN_339]